MKTFLYTVLAFVVGSALAVVAAYAWVWHLFGSGAFH